MFDKYDPDEEETIADLKEKFDDLGVSSSKSMLLARYLIEPPSQGEVVFNDQAMST